MERNFKLILNRIASILLQRNYFLLQTAVVCFFKMLKMFAPHQIIICVGSE